MKRGEVIITVMPDYPKAFDTVAHKTVMVFGSYLREQKQYVQIYDQSSEHFGVTKGVYTSGLNFECCSL